MNLTDYLRDKLRADGYTGVAGDQCGCSLEDFPACCEPGLECKPGYRVEPAPCMLIPEGDDPDCGGCDFYQDATFCFSARRQYAPPLLPAVSRTGAV